MYGNVPPNATAVIEPLQATSQRGSITLAVPKRKLSGCVISCEIAVAHPVTASVISAVYVPSQRLVIEVSVLLLFQSTVTGFVFVMLSAMFPSHKP